MDFGWICAASVARFVAPDSIPAALGWPRALSTVGLISTRKSVAPEQLPKRETERKLRTRALAVHPSWLWARGSCMAEEAEGGFGTGQTWGLNQLEAPWVCVIQADNDCLRNLR